MAGPWEKYGGTAEAPQVRPVFTAPEDPRKVQAAELSIQKTKDDIERDRQRDQRDIDRANREKTEFDQKQKQLEITDGIESSVEQGKAAAFAKRAVEASKAYAGYGLDPDSMIGQWGSQRFENLTALASDDKRNAARAAEKEFISAILRYDSGAAIPPSEFANAYQIYFPTSSAGPEEIKQKARARQTAIEGLLIGSGPNAERVTQSSNDAPPMAGMNVTNTLDEALSGTQTLDTNGYRFTPAQEGAINEYLTSPNATPQGFAAMMSGFAAAQGVNVDDAYRQAAEANGAKLIEHLSKGGKIQQGVNYKMSDADYKAQLLKEADANDPSLALGMGADRAVNQGVTLGLMDEIKGVGGMLTGEGYVKARDRERAVNERFANENPGMSIAGNLIGGLLFPGAGAAKGATTAAKMSSAVKTGAATGALAGFGYGEGGASVPNALIGAALGGATGGALQGLFSGAGKASGKIRDAFGSKVGQTVDADAIAAAGASEGVPVNRAMVAPEKANKVTAVESTLTGGPVIRGGMQEVSDAISGRVDALGGAGTPLNPAVAGEKVQGAADRFIKSSKTVVDRLYTKARSLSGDAKVDPKNAVAEIDAQIAELSQAPETNKAVIDFMQGLRTDLANGPLSIDTLRQIRTGIRGKISSSNLIMSDAERRAKIALDAASQDIETALSGKPEALAAFKNADSRYRQRREYIDQILKPVLGKMDNMKSPEKAFAQIEAWASPKGDAGRMAALWKSLEPEEAADLSATIASSLGRGAGGEFSPALFVSQAAKLSPRARMVAFGKEGAASIDNLVTLSNAYKRVSQSMNHSKSGVAINSSDYRNFIVTAVGMGGGGAAGGLPGMAVGGAVGASLAGKSYLSAKMLMSKDISNWLRTAPKTTNPRMIDTHFNRLNAIAARQPALAGEIDKLRTMLIEAAKESPGKATASEQEGN